MTLFTNFGYMRISQLYKNILKVVLPPKEVFVVEKNPKFQNKEVLQTLQRNVPAESGGVK